MLVNPDLTIRKAGGFIIQLLPTADDTIIDKVEKCISDIEPVTTMLDKGLSPETICRTVLPAFKLDVLDTSEPEYRCDCSREARLRALISMGRDELKSSRTKKDRGAASSATRNMCSRPQTSTGCLKRAREKRINK